MTSWLKRKKVSKVKQIPLLSEVSPLWDLPLSPVSTTASQFWILLLDQAKRLTLPSEDTAMKTWPYFQLYTKLIREVVVYIYFTYRSIQTTQHSSITGTRQSALYPMVLFYHNKKEDMLWRVFQCAGHCNTLNSRGKIKRTAMCVDEVQELMLNVHHFLGKV